MLAQLLEKISTWASANSNIEFGITTAAWAAQPLDPGTAQVLTNGAKSIVDKTGNIEKLLGDRCESN